jgi:hypothetical protein
MSYLQYNQGTNYSLYYNSLEYFQTIMSNHPSIAKVTTGEILEVDDREFPMYPLGNVNILSSTISNSTTRHEIQLIIADKIKNKDNESNPITNEQTIPFFGVDDTVDILANTLAIINDLTSFTQYSVQSFDIEGDILCEPFMDRFNNGLAGHGATFTLVTHNDRPRCIWDLYPSSSYDIVCPTDTTTTLTPTTAVPTTTLTPTTLVPTTLVPTTLVPTTLVPTTLVPTTTIAPSEIDMVFYFGNQVGGMGFDVCWYGINSSDADIVIQFGSGGLDGYDLQMSSDSNCTVPYGTSWNLNPDGRDFNFLANTSNNGLWGTTSGGSLTGGNYYRTRITGNFKIAINGGILSPNQSYDLTGTQFQDIVFGGRTVRLLGPDCQLNDYTGCAPII